MLLSVQSHLEIIYFRKHFAIFSFIFLCHAKHYVFQSVLCLASVLTPGAAELGTQGIQLHTLILEAQSYNTLEIIDLFILS